MRIVGGRLRGLKLAEVGAGDPAAHLPADAKGVLGVPDRTTAARMRATLVDSFTRS